MYYNHGEIINHFYNTYSISLSLQIDKDLQKLPNFIASFSNYVILMLCLYTKYHLYIASISVKKHVSGEHLNVQFGEVTVHVRGTQHGLSI